MSDVIAVAAIAIAVAAIAVIGKELYPFLDRSSNKRISRTSNHIVVETTNIRLLEHFPDTAVAIGQDGGGNQLVLLPIKEGLFFWDHETGLITQLAKKIPAIKVPKTVSKRRTSSKKPVREKLTQLNENDFVINAIPPPWKLFKSNNQ